MPHASHELLSDLNLFDQLVAETVEHQSGAAALALIEELESAAIQLREGGLEGGRDAFAGRIAALDIDQLELVGRSFTLLFHLFNAAEEQQRIRVLRRREQQEQAPVGSLAAAVSELAQTGVSADEMRSLLDRLFIMPVLTAHPTEARRRTVIELLAQASRTLDHLDDPRHGGGDRNALIDSLREVVLTLYCTEESRTARPSPLDEVRAGLHVFDTTLFEATTHIYRQLEHALAVGWPGEEFEVGPFLRWGTWIGGDRDGNPHVTADVTRIALERQRQLAITRHLADVTALGRELSVSARRAEPGAELLESLAADRDRLPEIAARFPPLRSEVVREKLRYIEARLEATRSRGEAGYPDVDAYQADLDLIDASLRGARLERLAGGRLRDVRRRAEVFGFHVATMDLRQHSSVHEQAVAELLARGGVADYRGLTEEGRIMLLSRLLDRADLGAPLARSGLSNQTRDVLASLEVVGRARRDHGPRACERYVISFTSNPSDVLEVLFLTRAAKMAPDEIRPVPLFEQLEDLDRADSTVRQLLELRPVRLALRGELETMIGYSDSSKQIGYAASQIALRRAQEALAKVADESGMVLTIFHGRGGAVGRGGGPASRAIHAQPPKALRGRLRVTEQGETISARYGREEIARRDLEQMVGAVLLASPPSRVVQGDGGSERETLLDRIADSSHAVYRSLLADPDRLARYAVAATPIQIVAELPIASRPSSRKAGLSFDDLRAIPWVFSWNQSRHGLPGWYGVGKALEAVRDEVGEEQLRELYRSWPFFEALIDNAQLGLVRSDMAVAEHYARLADPDARQLFATIRDEYERTVEQVLQASGSDALVSAWPAVRRSVDRRNPYVDVLSHVQITLLDRLDKAANEEEAGRIRSALFVTINGIAAALQTAG